MRRHERTQGRRGGGGGARRGWDHRGRHQGGGAKCARCWGFFTGLGSDARHPELCERCTKIVVEVDPEFTPPAKAAAEAEATV